MTEDELSQPHQPEQLDAFKVKDTIQTAERLVRRCAPDLGDRFLADLIERRPSTVHNQLDGSDPNKPISLALAVALSESHLPFQKALCKLLCPPPSLTPDEALDEIERELLTEVGATAAKKLRGILNRTRRREDTSP